MFSEKKMMHTAMPQQVESKPNSTTERANQKADPLPILSNTKEGNQNKFLSQVGKKDDKGLDPSFDQSIIESAADKTDTPDVSISEVDSPTTPDKMMQKRIPPRVGTEVDVIVNKGSATLSVANQDAGNGTVLVNEKETLTLGKGTHKITLKGKDQTTPGNSGKLNLVAKSGDKQVATSNGFSVAAIPQNWSVKLLSVLDNAADPNSKVGMSVTNSWESDSGDLNDLDQAERSESVEKAIATGIFSSATAKNSTYKAAKTGSITDTHAVGPREQLKSVGESVNNQTFKFLDKRTGAAEIPATNSGFEIARSIKNGVSVEKFTFQVTKSGKGVTANGITSKAGSGSATSGEINLP